MSFVHRYKWACVLLLLVFWGFWSARPLPLEWTATKLKFGQTIEEVATSLEGFDRFFTEQYPHPQATTTFTSKIRFADASVSVFTKISYTHRVGYLNYEYLDLYYDPEGKLVGIDYSRSS